MSTIKEFYQNSTGFYFNEIDVRGTRWTVERRERPAGRVIRKYEKAQLERDEIKY